MPLVLADRVRETTTTTGTGTVTLAGAVIGFLSFSAIGNGNTTYYTIAGQGNGEWEIGIGTYTSSGTTLSRDTVLASSAGAPTKTNFSSGTKDVFVTYTAARSVNVDGSSIDTFGLGAVQGDILYASSADNFARLPKNTTATRYLANTGTNNDPAWSQINLANGVTSTLPLGNGGTGQTTAQTAMNAFAGAVTSGQYLRGNGTNVVMSAIQAADVPTLNQNTTGSAATLTTSRNINAVSFNGSANITVPRVSAIDDRTTAPADGTTAYATFGFGSWNNNNTSPYSDFWLLRSYTDGTGGNDNMVAFRKDALGMRVWQQAYGSATAFASFKDVAWTDGTNASGTWGINVTGNAATATNLSTNLTNWSTNGTITAVVGQLAWKNYGNNHTIFDASNGTAPNGTAVNNTNAQVAWSSSYPTLMGWNGTNTWGVRVDSARLADALSTVVGSAPSYAARAWVNFNGTGTVAIRASGNVSSITDNGAGDYTVNFTTAMPDANYAVKTTAGNGGTGNALDSNNYYNNLNSTSSCRCISYVTGTGATTDANMFSVAIFR
jgi:hypothetical protein